MHFVQVCFSTYIKFKHLNVEVSQNNDGHAEEEHVS